MEEKHTLEPESVRSFIEQALKLIESMEQPSSKFFKFLIMSKLFLGISRRGFIYHLAIKSSEEFEGTLDVCMNSSDPFRFMTPVWALPEKNFSFPMIVSRLRSFVKLLRPGYFAADFCRPHVREVEDCQDLVRNLRGKISIRLPQLLVQAQRFLPFVQEINGRLHQLDCVPGILTEDHSIVSWIKLEKYKPEVISIGQTEFILRNLEVRTLSLVLRDVRANESRLKGIHPVDRNRSVRHFDIKAIVCSKDVLDDFFLSVVNCCPNLKSLGVSVMTIG